MNLDTKRINFLSKKFGYGLIDDDQGHVALVFDGMQSVGTTGKGPWDLQTTFFIEKKNFHKTVRQAIDARMKEERDEEKNNT